MMGILYDWLQAYRRRESKTEEGDRRCGVHFQQSGLYSLCSLLEDIQGQNDTHTRTIKIDELSSSNRIEARVPREQGLE